ncbi:MAG: 3-oxoacyl-ACP reductase FabG [Acidobacteria bacterium]|nr:3-oxoacyl-ACP reductase FabG [Acidobacteriota bacterium]
MPFELTGKTALVTGASKGVGRGIALALARAGCDVAVNYHTDEAGARATAAEIEALGRRAVVVPGHVGRSQDVDQMLAQAVAEFGRLYIWVNNAGVQTWKSLLELEETEWDRVLTTNLKGTFLCTQRAARHMKAFGGGRIINIGSGCNKIPFPNLVNYTASKGGIEMFTRVSAVELGPYGITVNCVAPGAIEIERTKLEAPDYAGAWGPVTPMRRIGYPADVAHAVCFLASDEAFFITGQTVYVDGGLFTQGPWPYQGEEAK